MAELLDLTGRKYGKLTVIELQPERGKFGHPLWLCECECGNKLIVSRDHLKRGVVINCGCEPKIHKNTLPEGLSSFNALYASQKHKAMKRDLEFSLTKEQFRDITSQNCHYCDIEPEQVRRIKKNKYGYYIHNGIDRIDSDRGYDIDNVVPCCKRCNAAKNDMTYEQFKEWSIRLYKKWGKKSNGS